MKKIKKIFLISIASIVGCMVLGGIFAAVFIHVKNGQYQREMMSYTRDAYVIRIESKFDAAREALAVEVDKYIKTVAPTSVVNSLNLIDMCAKYNVDIRLALVQGHVESHFATKGTAARTHSIFNVGAFDGYSAKKQIRNGYGYKHPDYSVEPYLKLLVNSYLVDGKTELDLLNKFTNIDGKRYASNPNYESMLRAKWDAIDEIANVTKTYDEYKMYKLMLGR